MILNGVFQPIVLKLYIQSQVKQHSKLLNLNAITIEFKDLQYTDAIANVFQNTITFNTHLLTGTGVYSLFDFEEIKIILHSVIIHELEHFNQYKHYINDSTNPIYLGVHHVIRNNGQKMSLYIKSHPNNFLNSVYVLQPNEYQAFVKGINDLKESSTPFNAEKFAYRIHAIDNAVNFIKQHYDIEDPIQEISNALMNLYDNGNRECSEEIQDLVLRCAICSYEDKEDYGINKPLLLLGERYEQELKQKIEQKKQSERDI